MTQLDVGELAGAGGRVWNGLAFHIKYVPRRMTDAELIIETT